MDSLTRHEEVQRWRIVAFARATLGDADYLELTEEIGQFLKHALTMPCGALPLDWMKSKEFYPTDHEYRKLLEGAIFANGRAFMARASGDADGAVLFMLMAENFFGQAERAYRGPKVSSRIAGKRNGNRFEPLRQYSLKLATEGDYKDRKKAAKGILEARCNQSRRLRGLHS